MHLDQVRIFVAFIILTCLVVITVITFLKENLGKVGKAFLGLVVSLFAWYFFHTLSYYLSKYHEPSYIVGTLAGVSVLCVGFAMYIFCEFFPESSQNKSSKYRILLFGLISLSLTPLTYSDLWIKNRGQVGVVGPFFYITSVWIVSMILSGVTLQIWKYRNTNDPRKRNRILRLLLSILFHLTITVFFSVLLPAFGSWEYFFLGPATSVLGLALIIYAIQFHPLLNFREAMIQIGSRLIFGITISVLIYFLITYVDSFLQKETLSYHNLIVFSLLFSAGILYGSILHPKLEKLIFQPKGNVEDAIVQVFLKQSSGSYFDLDEMLDDLLKPIYTNLGLSKILAVVVDHEDKLILHDLGENASEIKEIASRLVFSRVNRGRKLPVELVKESDRIFLLDEDASIPFREKTSFTSNYFRLVRRTVGYRPKVVSLGYRVVMPLVLQNQICGYLFLGDKKTKRPFFEDEVDLLERLRIPFAALIRNLNDNTRIRYLKNQAEAELRDLKTVHAEKEIVYQTVAGKTLVYRSQAIQETLDHIERIAPLNRPVFIHGETGTGKELFANLVHEKSRPEEPFVPLNCAALPANLWEDEIFGHIKGAFTDAKNYRTGAVEKAGKGTLFFDEIGEMPLSMQAKMLRLLQERQYSPIGSSALLKAECRFIFATNRNLEELIRAGEFREDLYYRINVFRIDLLPLRQRKEDILPLANFLLTSFTKEMNTPIQMIPSSVITAFQNYSWPGNIRELENSLLRALSTTKENGLSLDDFPILAKEYQKPANPKNNFLRNDFPSDIDGNFHEIMDAYALKIIQSALQKAKGNKSHAAKILGIRRSSLEYRLKR
ncbi:sigma 54-interacting transcriptional regulator [Leptospira idonii]|uniref:AAA family ATPase n=1 Tax=Leptospira idonii TaxID=1193500 RepID=A0A4R9M422_9LEPT|nr:sigma 54-interacting transcriptional regulator [Leptospira idonii]TGN20625.1 AAA family ATPase [Leptospira idonii]